MLKHIELKNFRKHEELVIQFGHGLNVIRGANEVGKSTLIEGALYALYGAKALRNSLSDTVTWGKKENELRVVLTINVGGVDYCFSRAKAGAECTYGDHRVTGQAEVSGFASDLLGADARTASLLMLSSQSGLRGALDDGPAAVSGLMGKLANFDLIDQILEAASNKLQLGSALPLQAKLGEAEKALASAQAALPDPARLTDLQRVRGELEQSLGIYQGKEGPLQDALTAADMALATARDTAAAAQAAQQALTGARQRLWNEKDRLKDAIADASIQPDRSRIEALRMQIQQATTIEGQVRAYKAFTQFTPYPLDYWDEPKADFDTQLALFRENLQKLEVRERELAGEILASRRGYITNGKCPTCGAVSMTDEHVKAKNAEVDQQISTLKAEMDQVQADMRPLIATIKTMDGIESVARRRENEYARIHAHIEVDESQYPPLLSWKGEVPQPVDVSAAKTELANLECALEKATKAQGRAIALEVAVAEATDAVIKAGQHAESFVVVDLDPLATAYNEARARYDENAGAIRELRTQIADIGVQVREIEAEGERVAQAISVAKSRITEYNEDLKRLEFNNTLVQKLKKLKPAITDHLWNTVLAAVSNFFSTLRGEQSVVTKEASGFMVNGQSIESLSGSTLDVLALAIRVALTKTFIPHASFMVLDEPAHGCDSVRTSNVLGFLSSVGFQQTILASHDELSESVADHVIALGA